MGRIRDAAKVLLGRSQIAHHHLYILRSEVPTLMAQLAELEVAVTSQMDKLNTMAARLRKREQRAAEAAESASAELPEPNPQTIEQSPSKAILRRQYAAGRLAGMHNGVR